MQVRGTAKSEQLLGVSSNDKIDGRAGDDYLNGGAGNDSLSGGSGNDAFGMSLGGGHDLVLDFNFDKTGINHDHVVFDGWGNFVDAIWGGRLPGHVVSVGMQFQTDAGHVLTVGQAADGDVVLSWETGESLELNGVAPGQFHADWMTSLNSYGMF
jgi:Ca2+-binding RTX toxin-like protein